MQRSSRKPGGGGPNQRWQTSVSKPFKEALGSRAGGALKNERWQTSVSKPLTKPSRWALCRPKGGKQFRNRRAGGPLYNHRWETAASKTLKDAWRGLVEPKAANSSSYFEDLTRLGRPCTRAVVPGAAPPRPKLGRGRQTSMRRGKSDKKV